MIYSLCKKTIESKAYDYDTFLSKLDVFLLTNRITNEQYLELKDLMDSQQENTEITGEPYDTQVPSSN